jgi:GT2 family glycosyltransferase
MQKTYHPLVYVIVLNWNLCHDTIECVESVLKATYPNFSILIVDNGSTDDSVQVLSERFPDLPLLQLPENRYYAGGNNAAIAQAISAGADYIMLLNNDTVVHPDFLNSLVDAMNKDSSLAAVGGIVYFYGEDKLIQSTGEYINFRSGYTYTLGHRDKDLNQFAYPRKVDYITGAAILIRSAVLKTIGLLDEHLMLYCEETDWCLRARTKGYRVMFTPNSKVFHKGSISTTSIKPFVAFLLVRNKIWLIKRHASASDKLLFHISGFFYRYPRAILGTLYRKEYSQFFPVIRGVIAGYFTDH